MITPQFCKYNPASGSPDSVSFTKEGLARLTFGAKAWQVSIDIAVPGGTPGEWTRSFEARAGEYWISGGGTGSTASPVTDPFSEDRDSVKFQQTYRVVNYPVIGSTRPGDVFYLESPVQVSDALYFPDLTIFTGTFAGGNSQNVCSTKGSFFCNNLAPNLKLWWDEIEHPLYQSGTSNLVGEIVVNTVPWV